MNKLKNIDFFELDRVLEDVAKTYAAPSATVWFKVTNNSKPTQQEYHEKVVEFIKKIENLLISCFPENEHSDYLKEYISKNIRYGISSINSGNNKEVERRYRYYVDYSSI
ncbi:MAG: hypothetical protein K0S93_334 [Nitrososphaeraceae archaeon]|jgi:hypothetical protein|nr:hypothetical protein [Nitrososphaeraceae archaeon]